MLFAYGFIYSSINLAHGHFFPDLWCFHASHVWHRYVQLICLTVYTVQ